MKFITETYHEIKGFVEKFNKTAGHVNQSSQKLTNQEAWYADWEDNYIGDFIDNPVTKACLHLIADKYYTRQLDDLLHTSTELTPSSYPSLYAVYAYCCKKLGICQSPKAYVTGCLPGINALSLEVGSNPFILIGRSVITRLDEKEQAFVIGHELGHYQQGNLICHTVNGLLESINNKSEIIGPLIADAIEVPLKRWCRCSEFNADRAGLICCGKLKAVEELFQKLGMCPTLSAYSAYHEIEASHPYLQTRLATLSRYAQTLTSTNPPKNQ